MLLRCEKILCFFFFKESKETKLKIKYYRLICISIGPNKNWNTYYKVIYLRHNGTYGPGLSYIRYSD